MAATDTSTDAIALGASFYEEVVTVRDFANKSVRPVLDRFAKHDHGDRTVYGLFLRGLGWFQTLSELKHPQHFQAALAGTRTLLEIAIDLALLHHDRANHTPAKILAWERSAKLSAAERTKRCFDGRELPAEHVERVAFIDREGAAIRKERALLWPNRRKPESHPQRWTGRALNEDAAAADQFGRYGVADFYDGRFAELCWGTHGSGLTGVRFVSEEHFPGIIAFAFQDSAWLGTLVCELSLRYYEKFDEILQARFRQMNEERQRWSQRAYAAAKAVPGFPRS